MNKLIDWSSNNALPDIITDNVVFDFSISEEDKIERYGIDNLYSYLRSWFHRNSDVKTSINNKIKKMQKVKIKKSPEKKIDYDYLGGKGTCHIDILPYVNFRKSDMCIILINTSRFDVKVKENWILHVVEHIDGNYIDRSGFVNIDKLDTYLLKILKRNSVLTEDVSRQLLIRSKIEFLSSLKKKEIDELLKGYRWFYNVV